MAHATDGTRLWVFVEDGGGGDPLPDGAIPIGFAVADFDGDAWTGERVGTDFEVAADLLTEMHVAVDGSNLYLSGYGGLRRFDRETLEETTDSMAPLPPELDLTDTRSLAVDEDGALWIATGAGVVRYQPDPA